MGNEQAADMAQTSLERIRELTKRKKILLGRIRKSRKLQIRARLEKRKINEELRRIKGKKNVFLGMTKEQSMDKVRADIEGVDPKELYPRGLERAFDKIERPSDKSKNYKIIDLGRIPENPRSLPKIKEGSMDDEHSTDVSVEDIVDAGDTGEQQEDGILDMSDEQ